MSQPSDQPDAVRARRAAEKIVQVLREASFTAYFAGGCVRDQIMGRPPSDYDVATDAPPQRVLELFRVAHYVGEAFGVVMVRISGVWVEVATFRTDVGYTDGRHPDRVVFTDARHDAQRRDFTINGLFYDPVEGRVIDYVGGQRDIEQRVIRAIGEPERRFAEDYLRMLRAVRFAARLHFEIEPATAEAIRHHASKLTSISRERIGGEVQMMLVSPSRGRAAHLMAELRLDAPVLSGDHVEREPIALARLDEQATYPTALAAWMVDRLLDPHRPADLAQLTAALEKLKVVQTVRRWRTALVLSNDDRDRLAAIGQSLPAIARWKSLSVAGRKRLMASPQWDELVAAWRAVCGLMIDGDFDWGAFDAETRRLHDEGVAPPPLITGDDLLAAGFKAGPAFKRVLDTVYDAQLEQRVTEKDEAMNLARGLFH